MEPIKSLIQGAGLAPSGNLRLASNQPAVIGTASPPLRPTKVPCGPPLNPQCGPDGVWRCCGHQMQVRPIGNYRAQLDCSLCRWSGEGRNYPRDTTDPFSCDDPSAALTEYQALRRNSILERDGVGRRYRRGLWSQCQLTDTLRAWHESNAKGEKSGLILSGGVGTGKTVATAMMTACLASRNEFSFAFWNISALLGFLHNWRDWGSDHHADATMQTLRCSEFLFLDDLGVEYNSPLAMSRLNELIETRYARELLHVCTSNLGESELAGREGWARIVDRLQENIFDWCELGGPSKRRVA